jgi:hypothetical protein
MDQLCNLLKGQNKKPTFTSVFYWLNNSLQQGRYAAIQQQIAAMAMCQRQNSDYQNSDYQNCDYQNK